MIIFIRSIIDTLTIINQTMNVFIGNKVSVKKLIIVHSNMEESKEREIKCHIANSRTIVSSILPIHVGMSILQIVGTMKIAPIRIVNSNTRFHRRIFKIFITNKKEIRYEISKGKY